MKITKNFGPTLRREIKEKGYKTFKDAADAFDISLSYLNQLMRNEREPSMELLGIISETLGVSSSVLLGDTPKPPAPANHGKDLLGKVVTSLTTLNEDELRLVAGFLEDLQNRRSRITKTVKPAVGQD